jgi:2-polyprenyl-6-methoxyphenol hydroxylase-like FAD-dependent oxidoreductase
MNMGFSEADTLGSILRKILREAAPLQLLDGYDRDQQKEWRALLGLSGGLKPQGQTNAWAGQRAGRILPCLPAYGPDLAALAGQLGLAPS